MRILVHMCCGPCALMPLAALRQEGHQLGALFYNPNIHPLSEYLRRREAALATAQAEALAWHTADLPHEGFALESWLQMAVEVMQEKQGQEAQEARCRMCYLVRLRQTAREAARLGYTAFTTTLLYSIRQKHDLLRETAQQAADEQGVDFVYRDFRPQWQEGIDRSKTLGLYRQNYCGCIYSEAERFSGKLNKLKG